MQNIYDEQIMKTLHGGQISVNLFFLLPQFPLRLGRIPATSHFRNNLITLVPIPGACLKEQFHKYLTWHQCRYSLAILKT